MNEIAAYRTAPVIERSGDRSSSHLLELSEQPSQWAIVDPDPVCPQEPLGFGLRHLDRPVRCDRKGPEN